MRIKTCLSDRTNSSSVGEETMKRGSTGEMKDDAQSKCNISPNTQELLRMQSFQNEDDGINLPSPRRLQMDKMSPSKDQTLSECPAGGSQNLSPNTAELHGLQDMIDFDNEEFSPTTLNFDSACPRLNQIEPVSLVDQRTSQRKSLPASKPSTHSKDVGKSKIPKLFPKEPQVNGSTPDAREGGEKSLAKMKASASLNRKRNDSASKRLQGKISPKNLPSPKSLSPTESAKSESPALRKEIEPLPLLSAQAVGSAVRSMLSSTSAVENESEAVEACSRQLGVEEDAASAGEEKTCRSPASVKLEPEDLDESQEETAANVEGEQDGIVLTPSDGKCCGHDPAYGGNEALETTPTNLVEVPYEKGVLLESSRKTQEIKERFAKYKREQLEKSQSKLSAAKACRDARDANPYAEDMFSSPKQAQGQPSTPQSSVVKRKQAMAPCILEDSFVDCHNTKNDFSKEDKEIKEDNETVERFSKVAIVAIAAVFIGISCAVIHWCFHREMIQILA